MSEPTLLQQARQLMESASHEDHLFDQAPPVFRAVDRMLQYLEERHAAASGPAQVPGEPRCQVCWHVADSAPHRWGSDDYTKHEFVPARQPESAAEADERLRLQRELADQRGQFKSFDLDLARTRQGGTTGASLCRACFDDGIAATFELRCHRCSRPAADVAVPKPRPTPTDADDAFAGYLDELEQLCDQATPGPWTLDYEGTSVLVPGGWVLVEDRGHRYAPTETREADARFIATARDALPKLIERVRTLERRIAKVHILAADFRDDPRTALKRIGEHLCLAEHYDRHPNAPRAEDA